MVVPELRVNDVFESVAEVEMSSADLVAEVDDEEQRVAHVEVYGDVQDDDQEIKGVVAQGERARPLLQPRLPNRQEVQEQELTHIFHRRWCVHCVRGGGRSDAHRRRARQDEEG